MAIPTVVDFGTGATFSTPFSTGIPWNSGVAPTNGRLLIATALANGPGATIVYPSGWLPLDNQGPVGANNFCTIGLFWKVASSEPVSNVWANSAGSGFHLEVSMLSIAGAKTSAAPPFIQAFATSNPITTGSLTPPTSTLVLASFLGLSAITTMSVSAGWTSRVVANDGSGYYGFIESNTALATNVTSTMTGTIATVNSYLINILPSGTVYPKTLTASLNVTAPGSVITGRSVTAALVFVGLLATKVLRSFATATTTPFGSLAKALRQQFTAIASPAANALSKSYRIPLIGSIAPAVVNFLTTYIPSTILKSLTSALALTGNVSRNVSRAISANIAAVGTISSIRALFRAMAGSVAPVGAPVVKNIAGVLFGIISTVGTTAKNIRRALAGSDGPGGSLIRSISMPLTAIEPAIVIVSKKISRTFTGITNLTGTVSRFSSIAISGALGVTSSVILVTIKILLTAIAGLSSSGLGIAVSKIMTGSSALTGKLVKAAAKTFNAGVSMSGIVSRSILKTLSGVMSLVGAGLGSLHKHFATFAGILNPVSVTVSKVISRAFTATENLVAFFVASTSNLTVITFSASSATAGQLAKITTSLLTTSSIGPIGTLSKKIIRSIAGLLGAIGALAIQKVNSGTTAFFASLAPVGTARKKISRSVAASALNFIGIQTKTLQRVLTSNTSIVATIVRRIGIILNAVNNVVGLTKKNISRKLVAFSALVGVQAKAFSRNISAAFSTTVALPKVIITFVSSVSQINGNINRAITDIIGGTTAFASTELLKIILRLSTSFLGATGSVSRATWHYLVGTIAILGNAAFTKIGFRFASFAASLSPAGIINRAFVKQINAVTNVTDAITRRITLPFALAFTAIQQLGDILTFAHHVFQHTFNAATMSSGITSKVVSRNLGANMKVAGSMIWPNILAAVTSFIGTLRAIFVVQQAPQRHFRIETTITDTISLSTPIYAGAWRTSSTS
jgi:hypothetical protein